MNKAIFSFVISAIIGLGIGYVLYGLLGGTGNTPQEPVAAAPSSSTSTAADQSTSTQGSADKATAVDENNIIAKRGCIQCHSVGSLNIKGGQVGPDLSQAYTTVEGKHGKPIEEFLKQPTSAVMSGVIGKNPLTDDQRKQVLELLKKASEAKQ
ncbi:cytochrome c [Bacillus sp. EB600]|uniref:cytochrome c n=1 Tax=Bacillus sp. EB600 TaxID=2806345 RepID=UPI00210A29EE|nr:cytochrome c [Bacillus sp. EB600]MCQ6280318.1 cytochrome C [Bacillus sp. EB600]